MGTSMASLLDNLARPSAIVLQLSVLLGVIFVLLKVLQFFRERKKLIEALEAFPGPPKHWFYGHNHLVRSELGSARVGLSSWARCQPGWQGLHGVCVSPALSLPAGEDPCTGSTRASAGQEERVLDGRCASFGRKESRSL